MYNIFMILIKKYLPKITFLLFAGFVVLVPIISFAQATIVPCEGSGKICNPIKSDNIIGLIKTLLEGVLRIGMPIVALAIIYCGFLFVSARGNSEKLTKAKDALLYTLIGAAILLGSWSIALLIANTVTAL